MRGTIGASEVACILGYNPWSSPFALWAKLHGLTESSGNAQTERGNILEPAIIAWYAKKIGATIHAGPAYGETPWTRTDAPWQAARPDGWWLDDGVCNLLEVKTCRDWNDWQNGIPAYYAAQVLWQQWIVGEKNPKVNTILVAYNIQNDEIRLFPAPYDATAQRRARRLSDLVTEWWTRHIVEGQPVEVDAHESTREAIRQMYARPTKEYLPVTPELSGLVADFRAAKDAHKATETPYELARNRLVAAIGNTSGIDGLCTLTAGKSRRLILKEEE